MELNFVPIPPDDPAPPYQLLPEPLVELYQSDSSTPDSEFMPEGAPELVMLEPANPAVPIQLTLARQLRAATIQATQLEALTRSRQSTISLQNLTGLDVHANSNQLSSKLAELEFEISLQTFDLFAHRGLLKYHEEAKRDLLGQITKVSNELITALINLDLAQITIDDLQAQLDRQKNMAS